MISRRCIGPLPVLTSLVLILVTVYLLLTQQRQVIIITPKDIASSAHPSASAIVDGQIPGEEGTPNILVPRGQAYYYTDDTSRRLGSFEVWRPQKLIEQSQIREKNWLQGIFEPNEHNENIFVAMVTNSQTMWKNIPTQQLTMFRHFKHYGLYGNIADSIGNKEVVDVLQNTAGELLEGSKSFETYRILRAIRESHANIGPEQVTLPEIASLKRFTLLPALLHVYENHRDYEWFVITDDDTTILDRNLREALSSFNPRMPLYLGSAVKGPKHVFASSGSVIVLSKEALRQAFDGKDVHKAVNSQYAKLTESECCGDYMLAAYLKDRIGLELDIEKSSTMFQGQSISSVKIGVKNWCSEIVSLGGQRPRDMELVGEYESLKADTNVLYSDIYLDFVKPYLYKTPQQNWDNGANDVELEPHVHSLAYPDGHKSLEDCKNACMDLAQCVMLRYDPYRQYCGLGVSAVALGKPVMSYDTLPNQEACHLHGIQCSPRGSHLPLTSMWFIDRVREMRRSLPCDVLYTDKNGEGVEYGALDQTEGWWHRAKDS